MLALAAALYAIHVLSAPSGRSVSLAPREYQLSIPFRPTQNAALTPGGTAAFITSYDASIALPQLIVVYRANGTHTILQLPADSLLQSKFSRYVGGPHGEMRYPGKRFENVALADDGTPFATVGVDFTGGYGGLEQYPFVWYGSGWIPGITGGLPSRVANLSVAAVETVTKAIYESDFFNYGAAELTQQQEEPHYDEDDTLLVEGSKKVVIGHGVGTAMRSSFVVGYEVDSRQRWSPAASVTAMAWQIAGTRTALGPGIAWAVNSRQEIVGDDRSHIGAAGHPSLWSNGRRIQLSNALGSAYGINDDGVVVGDSENGAFIWRSDAPQARNLDGLVHDRNWHIMHAFAISANGRILCIAADRHDRAQVVMLEPQR